MQSCAIGFSVCCRNKSRLYLNQRNIFVLSLSLSHSYKILCILTFNIHCVSNQPDPSVFANILPKLRILKSNFTGLKILHTYV